MEIMVRTRKSLYRVSRKGVKKVEMMDWVKLSDAFDSLFKHQGDKTAKLAFQHVDARVRQGCEPPEDDASVIAVKHDSFWQEPPKDNIDRSTSAIRHMKLTPQ